PALIELLNGDTNRDVVRAAAKSLDAMAPDQGLEQCMLRLARSRGQPDPTSVAALGGFSSRAQTVVPILIELTRQPEEEVALQAVEPLGALGEGAAPAIPRLIKICRQPSSEEFLHAGTTALSEVGVASPEVLGLFQEILPAAEPDGNHRV